MRTRATFATAKVIAVFFFLFGSCFVLLDAHAANLNQQVQFHITAQPLSSGLIQFSDQAGVQVISRTSAVATSHTNGVQGLMSVHDGLDQLLAGTGLDYLAIGDGTIAVVNNTTRAAAPTAPPDPPAPQTAQASSAASPAAPAPGSPSTGSTALNVPLGKIMVTGTLIPQSSAVTPSPVTIITAKQIQQSGFTTMTQVIQALTSANSGTFSDEYTGGFAKGASGISLRGLGAGATLILINGRRLASYALADAGTTAFVDLDSLPMNAVERIEVLNDGASSQYGTDAIAGVINIILYPTFNGSRATFQVGASANGGGGTTTDATFITGAGDLATQGWNAYLSLEWEQRQAIFYSERPAYNQCDLTFMGGVNGCVGGQSVGTSIYPIVAPATVTGTNADGTPDLLTGKQIKGTSWQLLNPSLCPNPVTFPGTGGGTGTGCSYNSDAMFAEIQPPLTRYGIDARFTDNLNSVTQAYVNLNYSQTRMVEVGGPESMASSEPFDTNDIVLPPLLPNGSLNPNNPFATNCAGVSAPGPAPNVDVPGCQYGLIEYDYGPNAGVITGKRTVNHNLRLVGDVNGALNDNWNYDTSLTINHTWLNTDRYGYPIASQELTDVTNGSFNFVNPAMNSQDVLAALLPTIDKMSTTDLFEWSGTVNGNLTELPGGPLAFAGGLQWIYNATYDPYLNPGEAYLHLGQASTIGHENDAAGFFEFDAPVLSSLVLDVSGREDKYASFGSHFAPKFGFKWAPLPQFAVRGTYSRGFQIPDFSVSGSGSESVVFTAITPPKAFQALHPCQVPGCSGPSPYAQRYEVSEETAANPDLQPQTSRNYTFGFVFQPIPALSGTLDYYNIVMNDVIQPPSLKPALTAAFAGLPPPPGIAVIYDAADLENPTAPLRPLQIVGSYVNETEMRTSGVDLGIRYIKDFGPFTWNSNFQGTDVIKWCETLQTNGPCVDMVGTHGPSDISPGAGTPQYAASWANSFSFGPVTITGTFHYISKMLMTTPDTAPADQCQSTATPTGANLPPDCIVPSFTYLNLTAEYHLGNKWTLTAGVLNALNRGAPFDPLGTGAYFNSTYAMTGVIGRFYQLGARVIF